MASQLVSLVWDGHHTTLLSVFEKLLVNSHFVDCTVAAEGQKMKAHKEVLSAFSPFFELLFKEETEVNPILIISGISFRDLKSLVDFMYQGKLEVTEDRIEDLIDAAECLQIKGLGGGHKEDVSGEINIIKVLPKRSSFGIPANQTRQCQRAEAAHVDSRESEVNVLNYSNEIQSENSVVITCGDMQSALVQNLMSNSNIQNLAIVSNIPMIPVHSTLSEIEMGSSHLQGEYVATKAPDPVRDENINGPMRERRRRRMQVRGNSGEYGVENVYECSGEESILGLSSDISVPSEKNAPLDRIHPIVSAVDTQDPLFRSESRMKGAASRRILESTYSSRELPAASVRIQRTGRNKPAMGLMRELPAEVNPRFSTPPSHTTPASDADRPGPIGRDGSDGSSLTHQYSCPICSKTFTRRESLYGHMRVHAEDPEFRDDEYSTAAVTSRKLNKQRLQKRRKLYKCNLCEFKSVYAQSLRIHMRIHSGVKPYKCTECKYTCADVSNLKRHQVKHNDVKSYKCTECAYTTSKIINLRKHQRVHNDVKPYKCTECDYTTSKIINLRRHQGLHNSGKPYKCTVCDSAFTHYSYLRRHQAIHSGVKPFKCPECNYATYRKDLLQSHQRIHNKKKHTVRRKPKSESVI